VRLCGKSVCLPLLELHWNSGKCFEMFLVFCDNSPELPQWEYGVNHDGKDSPSWTGFCDTSGFPCDPGRLPFWSAVAPLESLPFGKFSNGQPLCHGSLYKYQELSWLTFLFCDLSTWWGQTEGFCGWSRIQQCTWSFELYLISKVTFVCPEKMDRTRALAESVCLINLSTSLRKTWQSGNELGVTTEQRVQLAF
jgi:hypothetical protein